MICSDFEYDGITLSELGYIPCTIGTSGEETISNGSKITFNKISNRNGEKYDLVSTKYEECLSSTFTICKNPCLYRDNIEITEDESRYIMRWLNRKTFHKLKFNDENFTNIYFNASFNIDKIKLGDKIIALQLTMETDSPYAYGDEVTITINNTVEDGKHTIFIENDEEGYIYPHTEITVTQDGNLNIYNELEDRNTYIANCTAGEVITLDYPIIQSSLSSHAIQDDFNWNFFRAANSFATIENNLTISIPCTVTIKYSPIIKTGM